MACRATGVRVEKFSIGFGPEVLKWHREGTTYAVSLLPLGGFVKPAGESVTELDHHEPQPGDYLAAPLLSRIIIVIAGVVMNYVLAFVLFSAIFMMGHPVTGTTIGGFVEGFPAATSGLEEGDRIVALNGQAVQTWEEMTALLQSDVTLPLELLVEREGSVEEVAILLQPKIEETKDIWGDPVTLKIMGIQPHPEAQIFQKYSVGKALREALRAEIVITTGTYRALFALVVGKLSIKNLAGPVKIVSYTGDAVKLGLVYVLKLAAILSVSLAVINLLPIPALDGGHLLFLLIEGIRRRPVSLEVQEKATQFGFMLLMVLMVFVIYNDIVNY